jgi:nucleotidyltransferase/DNA polymerase involved in DNA repair
MSATIPAYSNAKEAYLAVKLKPGVFSLPCAERVRRSERASAPHIVYVHTNGSVVPAEQSSRPRQHANAIRSILESFTPAVDPHSSHGFYLNFFGSPYLETDFPGMLRRLQLEVLKQTGLSVNIGAARTRVGAAVASRLERQGGLHILASGTEATFFASLSVEALHGIGSVDAINLLSRGISSVAELRRVPLPALQSAYGDSIARQIWHHSRALDVPPARSVRWSLAAVLNFLLPCSRTRAPVSRT